MVFLFCFKGFAAGDDDGAKNHDSLLTVSGNRGWLLNDLRIYATLQGELVHGGSKSKTGLELTQVFEKTGNPWYVKMSIILDNQSSATFSASPTDSLIFTLGPGLGYKNDGKSGSAHADDPCVEAIASTAGKVVVYRTESTTAVKVP